MKKKLFLFVFIFLSFFFLLTSCDNKKDDNIKKDDTTLNDNSKKEETKKVDDREKTDLKDPDSYQNELAIGSIVAKFSYNLVEGDKVNPILEGKRDSYLYKVSDEKIINVNSKGEVEALSKGEAKLRIFVDDIIKIKYLGYIEFKVEEKEKIEYNCTEDMLKELDLKFNSYNLDNITLKTKTKIQNNESSSEVIMRKEPFYYEAILGDDSKTHTIIKKLDNDYYLYNLDDLEKTITKKKLNDLGLSLDLVKDTFDLEEFSYSKLEFNKINDNEYEIKYLISDMLDVVKELIGSLGNNSTIDGVMHVNIKFEENQINMTIYSKMHMVYSDYVLNVPYEINYEFSFNKITKFDLTDYITFAPTTMEECNELDSNNEFYVDSYSKAFSYKHLKEGKYAVEADDYFYNDQIQITLYDENKNKLNLSDSNIRGIENTFTISKEGNYYIEMDWHISSPQKLKFISLDYTVSSDAKLFESSKGKIKGVYDFNKYYYKSTNENELLKITNNGDDTLFLYVENAICNDWSGNFLIEEKETQYINPSENTIIYVVSCVPYSYSRKIFEYDYDFTVEAIDASLGRDINNPILLKEEYTNDFYYSGCGLSPLYFKVSIPTKGLVNINGMDEFGKTKVLEPREMTSSKDDYNFFLEKGEHIFQYYLSYDEPEVYKLNYEYEDGSDKDVYIDLKTMESEDDSSNFKVKSQKVHSLQLVRYHFTLDKDEILRMDFEHLAIYDSNDKLINFKLDYGYGYIKLKAGSYYVIQSNYWDFYLAKISYEPKTYIDFDNLNELKINDILTFKKDQDLDNQIVVYEYIPTSNIKLEFAKYNLSYSIFDEDFNKLKEYDWRQYEFNANKKYYIVIQSISTFFEDASLTVFKAD